MILTTFNAIGVKSSIKFFTTRFLLFKNNNWLAKTNFGNCNLIFNYPLNASETKSTLLKFPGVLKMNFIIPRWDQRDAIILYTAILPDIFFNLFQFESTFSGRNSTYKLGRGLLRTRSIRSSLLWIWFIKLWAELEEGGGVADSLQSEITTAQHV